MTSEALKAELALREEPQAVMLSSRQLQFIANTPFVPKVLRGKLPEILACVSYGRAMGLADMVALNGVHVIDGRPECSAELMGAIVRAHKHEMTGEVEEDENGFPVRAVVHGKRGDNGNEHTAVFSMAMAKRAELLDRPSWKKHPDDMLWARAVSKLCRRLFQDCFAGATYTPGETSETADEAFYDAQFAQEPALLAEPEEKADVVVGAAGAETTVSGSASDEPLEGELVDEPDPDPGLFIVPDGYQGAGKPLADVAEGPAGPEWMAWAADNAKDTGLREAATAFLGRLA